MNGLNLAHILPGKQPLFFGKGGLSQFIDILKSRGIVVTRMGISPAEQSVLVNDGVNFIDGNGTFDHYSGPVELFVFGVAETQDLKKTRDSNSPSTQSMNPLLR